MTVWCYNLFIILYSDNLQKNTPVILCFRRGRGGGGAEIWTPSGHFPIWPNAPLPVETAEQKDYRIWEDAKKIYLGISQEE